jgi:hypothetical protein
VKIFPDEGLKAETHSSSMLLLAKYLPDEAEVLYGGMKLMSRTPGILSMTFSELLKHGKC